MKSRASLALLLLVALPLSASAAHRTWVSGCLSGSTYAMSDVNADIRGFNASAAEVGLSLGEIRHGGAYGVSFGTSVGHGLSVGAGYDRLSARTHDTAPDVSAEYTLPVDLLRVLCRYSFAPVDRSGAFVEASVGHAGITGSFKASSGPYLAGAKLQANSLAFELDAGGQYWASSTVALTGSLGYRHAVAKDATIGGYDMQNADGSRYRIDYSGLVLRAGVTLPFWE